jgi:hypothetical protein
MDIINSALKLILIIVVTIILIMALKEWGNAQRFKAEEAQANAEAMKNIGLAIETIEKVVNTQQLQLVPMLKALYGSENIAEEINKYRESISDEDN